MQTLNTRPRTKFAILYIFFILITHLCELNTGHFSEGAVLSGWGQGHVVNKSVKYIGGGSEGVTELVHEYSELGGKLANLVLNTGLEYVKEN